MVANERGGVRIGQMEDKDGRETFYWISFCIIWFLNHIYYSWTIWRSEKKLFRSLDFLLLRSSLSHGAMQVKSLQVSFLAPSLMFPHPQEFSLEICKFSQCEWVWGRQSACLFYLISSCPGYTLFYTPTDTCTHSNMFHAYINKYSLGYKYLKFSTNYCNHTEFPCTPKAIKHLIKFLTSRVDGKMK